MINRRTLVQLAAASALGPALPTPGRAQTPAELAAFLKAEMDKWGPLIKEAGITGNE